MAEKVLARRTSVDVMFGGTDITNDIKPYLTSIVYTDDADDLADDLKIQIQDRDKVWRQKWGGTGGGGHPQRGPRFVAHQWPGRGCGF